MKDSLSKVVVFRGPDRILAHRLSTMTELSRLCSLQTNASIVDKNMTQLHCSKSLPILYALSLSFNKIHL